MFYSRQKKLNQEITKHNLDAFFITSPANIFYLLGLKSEDSLLAVGAEKYFFITDARFKEESQNYFSRFKNIQVIIESAQKPRKIIIQEIIAGLGAKKIGFEAKNLSFFSYQNLKLSLGKKAVLVPVPELVETLRIIKDKNEIDVIRRAVKITQEAFMRLRRILKPGQREADLAREIEHFIRLKGATGAAYDLIIASGKESSKPHAKVSVQVIKNNNLVMADLGVVFKEYNSDLTRTFFLGKIPSNLKKIKEIVLKAQKRAIDLIKPGVEISLLDQTARGYIKAQGYGDNFVHSLGHGIGLAVHEGPAINSRNKQKIEEGMVFTLEPAIYLPGQGGVRIEDMVLVTKKGCVVLSDDLNQSI